MFYKIKLWWLEWALKVAEVGVSDAQEALADAQANEADAIFNLSLHRATKPSE